MEEYSNAAGGTVPLIGQQVALPSIVMPTKKGGAGGTNAVGNAGKNNHKGKAHIGGGAGSANIAAFNSTKK